MNSSAMVRTACPLLRTTPPFFPNVSRRSLSTPQLRSSYVRSLPAGTPPLKRPRPAPVSAPDSSYQRDGAVAARIQRILADRGLTLLDISRESRRRYPESPAYWIPHHFYADLARKGFSPKAEQVFAFSAISGYRLVDWLGVFGVLLDSAPPLAAYLPAERTILLDAEIYDPDAPTEWFRSKPLDGPLPAIAPLGQLLESGPRRPLRALLPKKPSPFLYAKVGRGDAFAFPDLQRGSIVRIDTRRGARRAGNGASLNPKTLYLVEHSQGLTCCCLHSSRKNHVTLRSTELPYAEVELQLGREVRILGALDWEFRFLEQPHSTEVPRALATFWTPQLLAPVAQKPELYQLVKRARLRAGLSLREASARSQRIVKAFGDHRYFCTRGALAAYETSRMPTRRIHKIFSLCGLYSLRYWDVLAAAGLKMDGAGQQPIPKEVLGDSRSPAHRKKTDSELDSDREGFLSRLVAEFEEIPLFLRAALGPLTGFRRPSLRDLVWLGGQRQSLHPYLRGALLAVIHRQSKKPIPAPGKPTWEQPLHLLLLRDGSYICAGCSLENNRLIVRPFANGFERPVCLRNRADAEVVGKVVALLRKL
jgi:hypothetical protein